MKIMYINPYAGGPNVGRYWRAYYLAREWQSAGHEVTVVSPAYHHLMDQGGMPSGPATQSGVNYQFLPAVKYSGNGLKRLLSMLSFALTLLFFLVRLPRDQRPDLIIYSSAHPFAYPSALVMARLFGAKIQFEVRDLWPLSLVEVAGVSVRHPVVWLLGAIERLAYRASDRVISLLPGAMRHMASLGLRPEKFVYAPNGFSLTAPCSTVQNHTLLDDLANYRDAGEFIFFYAGALGEPNAMHKFVDALAHLPADAHRKLRFVIVGKGEQSEELLRRCTPYTCVSFYGQVDKSIVLEALKRVDAGFFVMHDLPIYRFGISLNKLYDYMAMALPVVGAYAAYNDPVLDAGCGLTVAPDQPRDLAQAFMLMSATDKESLKEMGERGRTFLTENFEYKAIARKILI
ncbi:MULTISPECIES: glycosyltransferase family 4 protein [Pseudomonas]|jgi:glycosyltransferase involved in cell wall biosynthesis|uniref:Glycosyltransferase subfamily 4-like N-terminal domain-containing protein n=1 Tax=Pseudomonas fluorescens TaxID=294 RepID=A0A5E6W8L3_PSEFL|nr:MULTISPECIES: glycosyltransferase family 4 protein [Pseudomonas]VVN25075.1 hypothetical protein PS631_04590 [Pseudomonas fluorescens]